ncbi:Major facilitator superfamily permease [Ignavibacterium album JCM 16511]|uniref:Major facilitator superfamily permease n=1 Tax=Ignavibacterium album (strain DSM 19864 / JCM 16511 / NBRC 101810 / Mat9-16) TaxID=945713 RepID=I0AJM1_IGNAJ|nr:tetracycline resistance MFS efflux pump [Ignavibacterium album]AFH49178.1 Major facilitator superfamily permease [Ignavibacterium album JCM 16511]
MKKESTALILIFLTVFIDLLGFGLLIPILPAFGLKVLNIDEASIGIVISAYSFIQFIFNPIFGRISDKRGRRPVIIFCLLLNAVGYLLFSITNSFLLLLLSRIIAGIGGSSISVAQAYIADVTTPENRSKGMGIIGSAFGLGFVFGPLLGGILSEFGYAVVGYVSAGFSFLAFVLTSFLLPESLKIKVQPELQPQRKRKLIDVESFKHVFRKPDLALLISLFFVLTFSFANIYGTFALLGIQVYHFTDRQNGYMFGIIGLTSAIVQGTLIGTINRFLTKKNIFIVSSFLISLNLALIPYAGNFLGLAVVGFFLSIGTGLFQPTILSLISEVTSEQEQGMTLGINQSMSAFGRMLGPLWGGFAFEYLGYQFPFLTGAFFTAVIFLVSLFYLPRKLNWNEK